jgi:hypothetical protein
MGVRRAQSIIDIPKNYVGLSLFMDWRFVDKEVDGDWTLHF